MAVVGEGGWAQVRANEGEGQGKNEGGNVEEVVARG